MASRGFYLACLLLGALGFLCILGTTYWAQHWRGGFAWDGGKHMFNWHPVLMVSGMVVLYGAASLVYRLPQAWLGPRLPWKALHAALHLGAFVLAVVGLVAVFRYHSHAGITHLYSLHSWLGLTTTVLFSCQPLHVFFGAAILSLSMASVISGINEKLFFSLKNATKPYHSLPSEAVFANSTGLLVVAFGVLVLYILLASPWKRPELGVLADRQEPPALATAACCLLLSMQIGGSTGSEPWIRQSPAGVEARTWVQPRRRYPAVGPACGITALCVTVCVGSSSFSCCSRQGVDATLSGALMPVTARWS
ncbi:Cytochrome b ascorbate-dependent protein 3 [Heterocephalus glaber]|uniref:Lysosomal membrane ascorbate-dependent ferrireductase CYB561A3 n=1 Tax=Heterocephalus glaber TaxID=10181 RepID=G5AYG4_HETGA|nr:Cytochrome b ascorbate-dependent protein 3 [Heterocephalus glaber]